MIENKLNIIFRIPYGLNKLLNNDYFDLIVTKGPLQGIRLLHM